MYILLALCITLHPQRIDEALNNTIRDKNYSEKVNKVRQRMQTPGHLVTWSPGHLVTWSPSDAARGAAGI
jgi:hypothetical protein